MATPYKIAIHTKDATFRLILTDHRGRVTERTAGSYREWLAESNRALNADQFDAKRLDGKSNTERRKPRYVRCESVCVLPSGEEVWCGLWTQTDARNEPTKPASPVRAESLDSRVVQLLIAGVN